jgi:hypothetical protein
MAIACAAAGASGLARSAHAAASTSARVDDACRTLAGDDNYKVRVQAALVLGRLADAGAVPCLSRALGDQNKTVRAMAAQALGQVGDPSSSEALRALVRRDPDPFVRAQTEKALAMLTGGGSAGRHRVKVYLSFGPFTGGAKHVPADAVKVVRETLQTELGKVPTVTLTPPEGAAAKAAGGFLIDGNVARLDDAAVAGTTETSCTVKVMVARWPSKSIISWTTAEASVQSGSRQRDKENARRECLEATAGQLAEDLAKFLKSQGG